jgi:hypothetical protein
MPGFRNYDGIIDARELVRRNIDNPAVCLKPHMTPTVEIPETARDILKSEIPKTTREEQACNIATMLWESPEAAALEGGELVLRASQERVAEVQRHGKQARFVVSSGMIHLLIDVSTANTPPSSSVSATRRQFT